MRTKLAFVVVLAGVLLGLAVNWLVATNLAARTAPVAVPGHLVRPNSPLPWRMGGRPVRDAEDPAQQGSRGHLRGRAGRGQQRAARAPGARPGPPEWSGAHARVMPATGQLDGPQHLGAGGADPAEGESDAAETPKVGPLPRDADPLD
jgi:hypothetical protein